MKSESIIDNPKRKKAYIKPGQPGPPQPKQDIHVDKVMMWDQKGVVYYELLKMGQTIDGPFYRKQLMRLKQAINQKRTEWKTRHETLIFHHDNARPHIEKSVKIWSIVDGKFCLTRLIVQT